MLSASTGTWSGSPTSYAYAWQRCDGSGSGCAALSGADEDTYSLDADDVGTTLRVLVSATNAGGTTSASSAPTAIVLPAAPTNTSPPAVSGEAREGQTLTASAGEWTEASTTSRQWERCNPAGGSCVALSGETGNSHLLGAADVGSTLRVVVTASNGRRLGHGRLPRHRPGAAAPAGQPLRTDDLGHRPGRAAAEHDHGHLERLTHLPRLRLAALQRRQHLDDHPLRRQHHLHTRQHRHRHRHPRPRHRHQRRRIHNRNIGGDGNGDLGCAPDERLPAGDLGRPAGGSCAEREQRAPGTARRPAYAYAWQRCDATGSTCTPLSGGDEATYELDEDDVGSTMRVLVTASNAGGSASASSAATETVTRPPLP